MRAISKIHQVKVELTNLDEVDEAMKEMLELERQFTQIKDDAAARVDEIKLIVKEQLVDPVTRYKELSKLVLAFAKTYKAYPKGLQNKSMVFGRFGFRKATEVKPKTKITWARVLVLIQAAGWAEGIRNKPEVNKEVIRDWEDDDLDKVGLRRVPGTTYYVELEDPLDEAG